MGDYVNERLGNTRFLTGQNESSGDLGTSTGNGQLERDPLSLFTCGPVTVVKEEPVDIPVELEQEPTIENALSWRATTAVTPPVNFGDHESATQLPSASTPSPSAPPLTRVPPKYANLSFEEYTDEMGDSIHEIIQESLGVFQKDPREYHPFYLRIFKYVMIGQRLGYVSNDEDEVIKEVWEGFFQLAKTCYEAAILQPVEYKGERSPYATFLLTNQVVIDDKVVKIKRDENIRRKKFQELEDTAKRLREEWTKSNSSGAELKDDVQIIFNFFKECQVITYPGDTLKMNNIWSIFLGGKPPKKKGRPSCRDRSKKMDCDDDSGQVRNSAEQGQRKSARRLTVKVIVQPPPFPPNEIPPAPSPKRTPSPPLFPGPSCPSSAVKDSSLVVTGPTAKSNANKRKTYITKGTKLSHSKKDAIENMEAKDVTKQPLSHKPDQKIKRRIALIASKPISSSILLQKKTKISRLRALSSQKPNPQNRGSRQLQLEKLLLQPAKKIMAIPRIKTKRKNIISTDNSVLVNTNSDQSKGVSPSARLSSPSAKPKDTVLSKITKSKIIKQKLGEPGKTPRVAARNKRTLSSLAKRRKHALQLTKSGSTASRRSDMSRSLEKIINDPNNRLNRIKKKRILGKVTGGEGESVVVSGKKDTAAAESEKKRRGRKRKLDGDSGLGSQKEMKVKKKKSKDDPDNFVQCEFCSCVKLRKRQCIDGIWAHMERDHEEHYEQWAWREVEKQRKRKCMIRRMQRMKARLEGVGPNWIIREHLRHRTASALNQYRLSKLRCPICQKAVGLVTMSGHLKREHDIEENGDLWQCSICREDNAPLKFPTRELWLTHMEVKHKDAIDKKELLEMAKKINIRQEDATLPKVLPSQQGEQQEKEHESLIDPAGLEKCNECFKLFDPAYLPIHKVADHQLAGPTLQCPACPKKYRAYASQLWDHYCQYHIKDEEMVGLDPVPQELREDAPNRRGVPTLQESLESVKTKGTVCELCGVEYTSMGSLSRHMYKVHGEGQLKENYWQCAQCPKQFKGKDILDAHVRRIHEGTVKSKCPHCSRDVQTAGKLWQHLMDIHGATPQEAAGFCEVVIILCDICNKHFLANRQFGNHAKTLHPEQAQELLKVHAQKIRESVALQQPRVGTFSRSRQHPTIIRPAGMSNLEWARHKNIVRKREMVQRCKEQGFGPAWIMEKLRDAGECPECGKEITSALRKHRLKEHGVAIEGGYRCPIGECNTVTRSKSNIRLHIRMTHSTPLEEVIVEKRIVKVIEKASTCTVFLCTLCQEYLYYYDQIKVHMVASHPEIFNDFLAKKTVRFPCPHCTEIRGSDEELRKHAEEKHADVCWSCPECSKTILDPDDMDKHFSAEHGEEDGDEGKKALKDDDDGLYLKSRRVMYYVDDEENCLKSTERMKDSREVVLKYKLMKVKCEICQQDVRIPSLPAHYLKTHGIREDKKKAFVCDKCPEKKEFSSNCRVQWLSHMQKCHRKKVDMKELVEEAGKVQTKVHWSKVQTKIPKGKLKSKGSEEEDLSDEDETEEEEDEEDSEYVSEEEEEEKANKKGAKGKAQKRPSLQRSATTKKNYRKLAGEEEASEDENNLPRNDQPRINQRKMEKRKNTIRPKPTPSPAPVRFSGRQRKPVAKYCFDSDDEEVTDNRKFDRDTKLISEKRRGYSSPRGRKRGGASCTKRGNGREGIRPGTRKDLCPLVNYVEQEKTLVIKLERLREEEVQVYLEKQEKRGRDEMTM